MENQLFKMDPLFIEGKLNSPTVNFNAVDGLLQITGRSIPEHPVKFYQPLEDWIKDYLKTNPQKITLLIYLDYMNTHSTECMLILLRCLGDFSKTNPNSNLLVEWTFDEDDEDIESLGQDLEAITNVPFTYKKVKED